MALPERVRIVDTSPRDGLQNECATLSTEDKSELISRLADAGLQEIEATSFVHPRVVPQLADAAELFAGLPPVTQELCWALIPNGRGLERAMAAGVKQVAFLTGASDTFLKGNIGIDADESMRQLPHLVREALDAEMRVRVHISTAFVCPFEGKIPPLRVVDIASQLLRMGTQELCIGDTLGAAVPTEIETVLRGILAQWPVERVALHLHDSSGTALANALVGLQLGIDCFDTTVGGLGGCPFAPGSLGNLATEDLVYMLDGMGIETGVDLDRLLDLATWVCGRLGREPGSRVWRRLRGS